VTGGAAHPEPPTDLHLRPLPLARESGPWVRAHALRNDPLYFGTNGSERFDDPLRAFGVCYVGADDACAFIETVTVAAPALAGGRRTIPAGFLDLRGRAEATLLGAAPLRLVDLTGQGLATLGADADLCSCRNYGVCQRWSRALHEHPESPDGLLYRARHDPSLLSVALFGDRVDGRIAMARRGAWGDRANAAILVTILRRYRLAEQLRG